MKANKINFSLFLVVAMGILVAGCSKNKDPKPGDQSQIAMKITVTASGADQTDQVDFGVMAANHNTSQYNAPVWKMNGTVQGNQNSILLDLNNFTGSTKTYVFETVKPFDFGGLQIHVSNLYGGPITISYKAEINGKIETSAENVVIADGQSHDKNFTYAPK
ncbi:hypothetical protein [Pedobacter nutrimenti]|nr:hypothetical protein [Pedobacter nutrimenti]